LIWEDPPIPLDMRSLTISHTVLKIKMRNKTFPMRLNQTIKWNRVNRLNKMEGYLNNQQKEFKNPIQMCKFPKIRKRLIMIKR